MRAVQATKDRWHKKGRFSEMLLMPQQQFIMSHSRRVKLSKDGPCVTILLLSTVAKNDRIVVTHDEA